MFKSVFRLLLLFGSLVLLLAVIITPVQAQSISITLPNSRVANNLGIQQLTFEYIHRANSTNIPVYVGDQHAVITNNTGGSVTIENIALTVETYYSIVAAPETPFVLEDGASTTITVNFTPALGNYATYRTVLQITIDGTLYEIEAAGLSVRDYEGGREPRLRDIIDVLGYTTNNGWAALEYTAGGNPVTTNFLGDEVPIQLFKKAGATPVQLIFVARYSPNEALPFGFYYPDGTFTPPLAQMGVARDRIGSPWPDQTLFPPIDNLVTIDPGSGPFGVYVNSPVRFLRFTYSEDWLNAPSGVLRRTRVYPLKDRAGAVIPNQYLLVMEDAANGDYQDYMFVLRNVVPATSANPNTLTVMKSDGATEIDVLANDSGFAQPDLPSLQRTILNVDTTGTLGTVSIIDNGTKISYNPNGQFDNLNEGQSATDTFIYTMSDNNGTDSATVTVTIMGEGVNEVPPTSANNDTATVGEKGPAVSIPVLNNDQGQNLSITNVNTAGTQGTASISGQNIIYDPNGQFTYLAEGENATDTFVYTVTGDNGSDTATVTVTITGVNDPPVANNNTATVSEKGPAININVTANDSDPDTNDVIFVSAVNTTGTKGAVSIVNNNTVSYDPNGQFTALKAGETTTDTFVYTLSDGKATDTATVTVTIIGVNDPPVANNDSATVNEEGPAIIIDVLANDSDPEGDTLFVIALNTAGTKGSVSIINNTVRYDPNGQFDSLGVGQTATDTFKYTVSDGLATANATVTVTVVGTTDPTATPDPTEDPTATPDPTDDPTATPDPTEETETPVPTVEITPEPTEETPTPEPTPDLQPGELAVTGNLTNNEVLPVFVWAPSAGGVAEWYNLVIVDEAGNVIYNQWLQGTAICQNGICSVTPTTNDLPAGLLNGLHYWTVGAYSNGVFAGYSDFATFTVNVPLPTVVPESTSVVDTSTGRVLLNLPNDPGVSWVQVWVGTPGFATLSWSWYPRSGADCNATTCTYLTEAHPANGSYIVYFQTWGPAGFNGGSPLNWSGPFRFDLVFPDTVLVNSMTATSSAGNVNFSWKAPPGATWYLIWSGLQANLQTTLFNWYAAVDLGCPAPVNALDVVCTLPVPVDNFFAGQNHLWYVVAWGPGGFSTGGIEGWAEGPIFAP